MTVRVCADCRACKQLSDPCEFAYLAPVRTAMAAERPAEARRDPLAVIEVAATDNLLLVCKDGHVLTDGDLLAMLSPDALASAVDVARKDHAEAEVQARERDLKCLNAQPMHHTQAPNSQARPLKP